jgi:hypothetical protein
MTPEIALLIILCAGVPVFLALAIFTVCILIGTT